MDDSFPQDNYGFVQWLDSSQDATRTVVMSGNTNLTAIIGLEM